MNGRMKSEATLLLHNTIRSQHRCSQVGTITEQGGKMIVFVVTVVMTVAWTRSYGLYHPYNCLPTLDLQNNSNKMPQLASDNTVDFEAEMSQIYGSTPVIGLRKQSVPLSKYAFLSSSQTRTLPSQTQTVIDIVRRSPSSLNSLRLTKKNLKTLPAHHSPFLFFAYF